MQPRSRMGAPTWPWMLRGIASIAFGVLILVLPGPTVAALVIAFGVYAFVDGLMLIGAALRAGEGRGWFVLRGLLGLAAGAVTFAWPGLTAFWLYVIVGAWAVTAGLMELTGAIAMRSRLPNMGVLALTGAVMLAFGIVLLAIPRIGIAALLAVAAAYGFVHGVTLIGIGTRMHEIFRPLPARAHP